MKMTLFERLRAAVPKPMKRLIGPLLTPFTPKHRAEISYWRARHRTEGGRLANDHYRRLMLAMAAEADEAFLTDRVVADFGCGPRGSLAWVPSARLRIGIDVLASRYADAFPNDIRSHGMLYVTSTEQRIPMPDACVDVMFTLNALDHCRNLDAMCREIVRVIRPGGQLIGSFNLHEPPTAAEPQTLTEELLDELLLHRFRPAHVRFGRHGGGPGDYAEMFSGASTYVPGKPGTMWFRGSLIPAPPGG